MGLVIPIGCFVHRRKRVDSFRGCIKQAEHDIDDSRPTRPWFDHRELYTIDTQVILSIIEGRLYDSLIGLFKKIPENERLNIPKRRD